MDDSLPKCSGRFGFVELGPFELVATEDASPWQALPRIQSAVALAVIDHAAQLVVQLVVLLGHGALADQCWTWMELAAFGCG